MTTARKIEAEGIATKADALLRQIEDVKIKIASVRADKQAAQTKIKKISRDEIAPCDREIEALEDKLLPLKDQLNDMQQAPRVSDHAVIRLLERKYGFDFEDMRKSLLTDTVTQAMDMGATSVKVDGMTLRIRGKCITTIV